MVDVDSLILVKNYKKNELQSKIYEWMKLCLLCRSIGVSRKAKYGVLTQPVGDHLSLCVYTELVNQSPLENIACINI